MSENNTRPQREYRAGTITAAVWTTPKVVNGRTISEHSIRIQKRYRDERSGQWKSTTFFRPDERMHRKNTWRDFDAIRRGVKLPPCSIHDLRRSFCTNLSRVMPMHVVQELAGHSDIRTTRRYYVSVQPELLDEARRAVERSLAC